MSDWIQILGICASLLTSITAIIISIKTLQQNSKMIEESTRPYITIYYEFSYVTDHHFLILKNFGKSSGKIISLECDYDLKKLKDKEFNPNNSFPFLHIKNTTLVPNQSLRETIYWEKQKDNSKKFDFQILNFKITYEANGKTYIENVCINPIAYADSPIVFKDYKPITRIQSMLNTTSLSMQEITEKLL